MLRKRQMHMLKICFILLGVVMVATAVPTRAGSDEWSTADLTGYNIQTIAIDPTNSNTIYAGTERGMLVSQDGGQNWRGLGNIPTHVYSIAVNPADPATLYAAFTSQRGREELFKSVDGGETWATLGSGVLNGPRWVGMHPLRPDVIYVISQDGLFRSPDAGNSWASAGLPSTGRVQTLAFDPANAEVMYVVLNQQQGLFRTGDGGQSWSLMSVGVDGRNTDVYKLAVGADGVLVAMGDEYIFRSRDGGQSWQTSRPEDYWGYYGDNTGLAVDNVQPQFIYLGWDDGIYRSEDGGDSWTSLIGELPGWPIQLVPDPLQERVLYALVNGRLYKSADGGQSWQGPQLATSVQSLAAHPANPGQVFAFAGGWGDSRLWRSLDGGQSWNLSNVGLEQTQIRLLAFDPADANRVYVGTQNGLYRSIDGGQTWNITGLPTNVQVNAMAVDPQNNANLFVGGDTGLLRSANSGESWTAAPFDRSVTGLAIDPLMPQNVYAVSNNRLHHSSDGGASWRALALEHQDLLSVSIKPDDSATIYTGGWEGLFISHDGGDSWNKAAQIGGEGNRSPLLLQTDPRRPEALYAAYQSNIYISPDAGVNWFPLKQGLPGLFATGLAVDAGDPLTLYATFQDGAGGVWRYTMNNLPEPPTPTPSPTPPPTATPRPTQTPRATATPASRLAATGTALALVKTDTEATAVTVFGLDNETGSDGASPVATTDRQVTNEQAIDSTQESGSVWPVLIGVMVLAAVIGGGVLVWRYALATAAPVPAAITCPNCGTALPAGARFCARCGQQLNG